MTKKGLFRGRDLGKQVVFDFPSNVLTTPRDQLEKSFADLLVENEKVQDRSAIDEIELSFLRDTLSKIRAGVPLITVSYPK